MASTLADRDGRFSGSGRDHGHGRIELMGMAIDRVTEGEAIATVVGEALRGRGGWVITPNLDHLRQFCRTPALRSMFDQADLVLADGMPLVWASRLQRTPLPERVAGSDLIGSLSAEAARRGLPIFLLGGNPGAAELAEERLCEASPRLRVTGRHCPPFGYEDEPFEIERIVEAIQLADPAIAFVALSFPKQDELIARIRDRFPRVWFIGVGVSFSFVGGEIDRAPRWMRGAGLEWTHRLAQEPQRLFGRYVLHGLPFALSLMGHAAKARDSGRASRDGPPALSG